MKEQRINWREAFEAALAGGGEWHGFSGCKFCFICGVGPFRVSRCRICVLAAKKMPESGDGACVDIFGPAAMDNAERRAICRHVLATVQDFTDRDEIRARIAEMLDDEAREKFLGRAEEGKATYWEYDSDGGCMAYRANQTYEITPKMLFLIEREDDGHISVALACADKEIRDRVLAFLNGEKQNEKKTCGECGWFNIREEASEGTYGECKRCGVFNNGQHLLPTNPACNAFECPKYREAK